MLFEKYPMLDDETLMLLVYEFESDPEIEELQFVDDDTVYYRDDFVEYLFCF